MKEKVITRKNGMAALLLLVALYVVAIFVFITGVIFDNPLIGIPAIGYLALGWIGFIGLKVIKPQEKSEAKRS